MKDRLPIDPSRIPSRRRHFNQPELKTRTSVIRTSLYTFGFFLAISSVGYGAGLALGWALKLLF